MSPTGPNCCWSRRDHPAVGPFKAALVADGIPYTSFEVADVEAEHDRLVARGVRFTQPPTAMGPVTTAVFDDTCGNLIQTHQPARLDTTRLGGGRGGRIQLFGVAATLLAATPKS